jgi:thioredoxin 1
MNSLAVQNITSPADFQAVVLDAAGPTLVYFWGTWCTSCKALSPRVDALAQNGEAAFKVVKVEVSQVPEIAEKYGVMSVPTMLLFRPGHPQPKELTLSTYVQDWAAFVNRRLAAWRRAALLEN